MQRDPLASSKARKAEQKADEKSGLITIRPVKIENQSKGGSGFKKGGFRNAFGLDEDDVKVEDGAGAPKAGFQKVLGGKEDVKVKTEVVASESEEDDDRYDPRRPTDCFEGCQGRHI